MNAPSRGKGVRRAERRGRVLALLEAGEALFRRQGTVQTSHRSRGGRRHGPYFRLIYRDGAGRHRTAYLGRDAGLADEVRGRLAALQAGVREAKLLASLKRHSPAGCRAQKRRAEAELRKRGLYLKGWEIRGLRGLPGAYGEG